MQYQNHSYKIGDISVNKDTISAICISTKNNKEYNLYFVINPKKQVETLSNLIGEQ